MIVKSSKELNFYDKFLSLLPLFSSIFSCILLLLLLPDLNAELGFSDIPYYVGIIKHGGVQFGKYGFILSLILHGFWTLFSLKSLTHMVIFIKFLRICYSFIIIYSISEIAIKEISQKKNLKVIILWCFALISFNLIIFRSFIFIRFRFSVGLSFFFLGLRLLNIKNFKCFKAILKNILAFIAIIVGVFVHELILIIFLGLIAGVIFDNFVRNVQEVERIKNKKILILGLLVSFEILVLIIPFILSKFEFVVGSGFEQSYKIIISDSSPYFLYSSTILIVFFILLIFFQVWFIYKNFNLKLSSLVQNILFSYFIVIGLVLLIIYEFGQIIIKSRISLEILFLIMLSFFWMIYLFKIKCGNFSRNDWVKIGLYLFIATINRYQQYFCLIFQKIGLINQFTMLEYVILTLFSLKHFCNEKDLVDSFLQEFINSKIKHVKIKEFKLVQFSFYTVLVILILQNQFLLIYGHFFTTKTSAGFYHSYVMSEENKREFKDNNEFDQFSLELFDDIQKFEKNLNQEIRIITNDARIARRLQFLTMRDEYYIKWGQNLKIWVESEEEVINLFDNRYESEYVFVALAYFPNSGLNVPHFDINANYSQINNYSLGILYLHS